MSDISPSVITANPLSAMRSTVLCTITVFFFASNSVLCRLALKDAHIDPASFTAIRLVSGALMLALIVSLRGNSPGKAGNWSSALALFGYAAAFSFAYVGMSTATGALLLFGSVHATMTGYGLWRGERLNFWQTVGLAGALGGLLVLLLPGFSPPPPSRAIAMMGAGASWGIYSLRAKGTGDPTSVTAGNFLRAAPMALILAVALLPWAHADAIGIGYALASGALASGLGYAIWYTVLQSLKATTAATVQLGSPAIAAFGGVVLLAEPLTLHLIGASAAILGGIGLVILARRQGG